MEAKVLKVQKVLEEMEEVVAMERVQKVQGEMGATVAMEKVPKVQKVQEEIQGKILEKLLHLV